MWGWVLAGLVLCAGIGAGEAVIVSTAYAKGDRAGWDRRDAAAWQSAAKASEAARRTEALAAQAAAQVNAQHVAAAEQVRTVYRTIEREVPTYVTPAMDARFPLSVGFVRLHDAAALGVPAGHLADPGGLADDAASPVVASLAALTVRGNYEACASNAEQLSALQAAVRAQPGYPR